MTLLFRDEEFWIKENGQSNAEGPIMGERNVDAALVKQVLKGDDEAFDILVLKYQDRLHILLSRYLSDPSDAHDLTQETFIKAYYGLTEFRNECAFFTWIYRIAVNNAKNFLVAERHRPKGVSITDAESFANRHRLKNTDSPEGMAFCDEVESALFTSVSALPEDLRSCMILRDLAGLSYDEIAIVMQVPVGTVRSRIYRARTSIDGDLDPILKGHCDS